MGGLWASRFVTMPETSNPNYPHRTAPPICPSFKAVAVNCEGRTWSKHHNKNRETARSGIFQDIDGVVPRFLDTKIFIFLAASNSGLLWDPHNFKLNAAQIPEQIHQTSDCESERETSQFQCNFGIGEVVRNWNIPLRFLCKWLVEINYKARGINF